MELPFLFWVLWAYLMGALPWSVWLGRLVYGIDPRDYGDGNPGAANAFRAGGKRLGAAVILLDFFKAFIPVFVAKWGGLLPPEQLFWVTLAPVVGHAFSVFLRFRGGRALVALFGVWSGLTLYEVPVIMGLVAIVFTFTIKRDAYSSLALLVGVIFYLILRGAEGWLPLLALVHLLLLVIKIGPARLLPASITLPHQKLN
jgi:glycerol-3-phosphate acyltransferase PlsY